MAKDQVTLDGGASQYTRAQSGADMDAPTIRPFAIEPGPAMSGYVQELIAKDMIARIPKWARPRPVKAPQEWAKIHGAEYAAKRRAELGPKIASLMAEDMSAAQISRQLGVSVPNMGKIMRQHWESTRPEGMTRPEFARMQRDLLAPRVFKMLEEGKTQMEIADALLTTFARVGTIIREAGEERDEKPPLVSPEHLRGFVTPEFTQEMKAERIRWMVEQWGRGYTCTQIAKSLCTTVNAVRKCLKRATK